MRHLAYVAVLLACALLTVPLVPIFRLRRIGRIGLLSLAIGCAVAPFVAWDIYASAVGHWHFDPAQTLPPRVFGLPLEEFAFFVVIPFAAIATWEAVGTLLARRSAGR